MRRDHTKLICDIGELTGLFADTTGLDDFLQKIVEMISEHMHSEVCSIYLYYQDTQELVLKATRGLKRQAIGQVKLRLGEGLTGLAVKELRPICEKAASQSPNYRYFPEIGEEPYDSFLAVPILHGQNRVGAVVIQNSRRDYFTEEDVRVFQAITSQLANTIEMAKLLIGFNEKHKVTRETGIPSDGQKQFIKGKVGSEGFAFSEMIVFDQQAWTAQLLQDARGKSFSLEDFHQAVRQTESQLEEWQKEIEAKLSDVASLIFTAQILMLKDQPFVDSILRYIEEGVHPPQAIVNVVEQYARMFDELPNHYLREKKYDVRDIGNRLLENMTGVPEHKHNFSGRIVVARELFPSDILKLSAKEVAGVILLSGGMTSHVSILARSLNIPLVISEAHQLLNLSPQCKILLDGEIGNIYVNPDKNVISSFKAREEERAKLLQLRDEIRDETFTQDGIRVDLLSNINLLTDLKAARDYKSCGIGLYRTEFPFIIRNDFPSEEEQYQVYRKLIMGMSDKEITFRTLDIGGDKVLSYYDHDKEPNPFLGMRSIRFSLKHKDVFEQQIRAILRAGPGANLRIMFPMISSLDQFLEAKQVVLKCIRDLNNEDIECHDKPQIGMMVELPAVLEIIEDLAQAADFFSVGTNDFIQYMLAIDRTNEKVADLYLPHHPSILRALKKVVGAALKYQKDVSICGDMAHDEKFLPYFLGIGIRKLSLTSQYIPKIQKAIENLDFQDACHQTEKLLTVTRLSELDKILN